MSKTIVEGDVKTLKFKCKHDFQITDTSNIIQLDSMGYPLMLCIRRCTKCGASDQSWIDVPESIFNKVNSGEIHICKWKKIN